ncbi:MAG: deoxyuridine 5'-triphosphate nucleotidohydrolase [Candidatus Moranbacteria bacterium RIFCSPHIGHO2_01_FULL_55_24]|nr:MAG: deoxyuridine 5'-triphosphate nucleotidohydrolase [Candidatus Moranbacteria bacterium RIFCSPHIGHO2_01_FULL_55_24]
MELQVKKLDPEAKLPTRAHADDAGLDLYALEESILEPGARLAVRTGIALAIPKGFTGLVWDKSGLAAKAGIKTMGGVVDAGYRGEVQVIVVNIGPLPYTVEKGAKIAQLLVQKVELPEICEVSELDDTLRGEGGFGSTGTH